ncbi:hypothetical protein R1sor_002986 [Riccia sorocarpa]|uniref:Uncharacterized protein n=1 Tax=Riccia sorocarpa TaxID=122646 RepID=A0ABD3H6F8_9MARC
MIAKLVKLLSLERLKRKGLAEQHVYLEEKITRAEKASADEITKLEGRLQECTDSLVSLLGQNPLVGGLEPDSDDSHVTYIVDLAKMMIAEE